MRLSVVVADDEPLARQKLRRFIDGNPEFRTVAEAGNGPAVVDAVKRHNPDVLFLDVEMPGGTGFDVLAELEPEQMPLVVFTTAYDHYAVKAFEAHALDYLLKPFDEERFKHTADRIRGEMVRGRKDEITESLLALLNRTRQEAHTDRLIIKSAGKVVFLNLEQVDWIEAAANYVCLHAGREEHLLRETMQKMENRLDKKRFVRVHRSFIVNVERIKAIDLCHRGEFIVTLSTGKELAGSRSYRENIAPYLKSAM